jgi:hypothetical protein
MAPQASEHNGPPPVSNPRPTGPSTRKVVEPAACHLSLRRLTRLFPKPEQGGSLVSANQGMRGLVCFR